MISKEMSKELFEQVMDIKLGNIYNKEQELIATDKAAMYTDISKEYRIGDSIDIINIHVLAHKCKEWAYKQGYVILSGHSAYGIGVFFCSCKGWLSENYDKRIEINHNTEPEAIFKACQWILENKN